LARRYADWLAQAQWDLKAAQDSLEAGHYEWSAFQCQQAAEKALKALLRYHNLEMTGHTLLDLLERVGELVTVAEEYEALARELDRHYIQPRYPNSFASGYPRKFYDRATAERCVQYATRILDFVRGRVS